MVRFWGIQTNYDKTFKDTFPKSLEFQDQKLLIIFLHAFKSISYRELHNLNKIRTIPVLPPLRERSKKGMYKINIP